MRPVSARAQSGFTLIEILIASALALALLGALYTSFFTVLKGQSAIEAELERTSEFTRFMDTLTREVRGALYSGTDNRTFLRGTLGDIAGASASELLFTTVTYPVVRTSSAASDVLAVRYSLEKDASNTLGLYKRAWSPYREDEDKAYKAEVMGNVTGFEVSFYNGKDWAKAWDTSTDKSLPKAIRIKLSYTDRGEEREFTKTARTFIR